MSIFKCWYPLWTWALTWCHIEFLTHISPQKIDPIRRTLCIHIAILGMSLFSLCCPQACDHAHVSVCPRDLTVRRAQPLGTPAQAFCSLNCTRSLLLSGFAAQFEFGLNHEIIWLNAFLCRLWALFQLKAFMSWGDDEVCDGPLLNWAALQRHIRGLTKQKACTVGKGQVQ